MTAGLLTWPVAGTPGTKLATAKKFAYRVYLDLLLIFDGVKRQNPRAAVRAVTMHRAPRPPGHRVILIIDRESL